MLGEDYDLSDQDMARRADWILWKLLELKLDGPVLKIKDGRNHDTSFVWVPKSK